MKSPVSISQLEAGWAVLGIGDSMYAISYLSDLKSELDYVFDLNKTIDNKATTLEMESDGTLCIQTLLDYDVLYVTVFRMYDERIRSMTYRYRYKEFLVHYIKQMEDNKQAYIDDFMCLDPDEEPYVWDNEDYIDLKKIVSEE